MIGLLLLAEWKSFRNRTRRSDRTERRFRTALGLLGALVVILIFTASYRFFDHILFHLDVAPELGIPLTLRLVELVHLLFFVMLVISSLTVALSVLFLDREIAFLVTTPAPHVSILLARLFLVALRSCWFVILGGAPMLLALACVMEPPIRVAPIFLVHMMILSLYVIPPAMIGAIGACLIVRYIPARQAKAALLALSIAALSLTVIGIRAMTPERFLRPTIDPNLGVTLTALAEPASPWLPSGWASNAIVLGDFSAAVRLAALAAIMVAIALGIAKAFHLAGLDRIATERMPKAPKTIFTNFLVSFLPKRIRLLAKKEIILFWRNPTQWSQLIVLLALVVIYVFNFSTFRGEIETRFLRNAISLLNLGMAGFVLVAVANRFVFSGISMEGRAIWLLRSAPFPISRLLVAKTITALVPLLLLAETITIFSNQAIDVSDNFANASILIVALMTCALTFLGVGLGALTPRFDLSDPAQIGMTPTGILYMGLGLGYVAIFVTVIATHLVGHWAGRPASAGAPLAGILIVLNACAIILPWRTGVRRIEAVELR